MYSKLVCTLSILAKKEKKLGPVMNDVFLGTLRFAEFDYVIVCVPLRKRNSLLMLI